MRQSRGYPRDSWSQRKEGGRGRKERGRLFMPRSSLNPSSILWKHEWKGREKPVVSTSDCPSAEVEAWEGKEEALTLAGYRQIHSPPALPFSLLLLQVRCFTLWSAKEMGSQLHIFRVLISSDICLHMLLFGPLPLSFPSFSIDNNVLYISQLRSGL